MFFLDRRTVVFPSLIGATAENIIRQPLTAVTIIMINNNQSLSRVVRDFYKEGGINRFYNGKQGFLISWLMRSSHRIATFGINEKMNKLDYSNLSIAIAITTAEFVTTAFAELLLTVAQNQSFHETPISLLKKRYYKEGFRALTTGFLGNSARNGIFNAVLFGFKNKFSKELREYPITMPAAISLLAVTLSHPPEVIRSLKVNNPEKSYLKVTVELIKSSGLRGIWKGLLPRIASVGVGTFITVLTFNYIYEITEN